MYLSINYCNSLMANATETLCILGVEAMWTRPDKGHVAEDNHRAINSS